MIFNPLFLNESGNSKFLVPSSKKLSQNKYLFSDIVKVVMNPINDAQKLPRGSENLLALQGGLTVSEDQNPVKLKLNFLKDIHPEKTDKSLAELLPKEIVKLIEIKDNSSEKNDAVSYLSQEILDGELHALVKDLLGADFINKNLSTENGLLLSLEDKTSAVNFELAKVNSKYTSKPQIAVQTIVVPMKSKLFSKISAGNREAAYFRFNHRETTKLEGVATQKIKPVISVYSFKLGTEDFQSLTQTINKTTDLSDPSSIKSVTSTPFSEYKQNEPNNVKYKNQKLNRELLAKNLAKSNLFQTPKEKSEFTVNNITILKKSVSNDEGIDANNSKELKNILINKEFSNEYNNFKEGTDQIKKSLSNNAISSKDKILKEGGLKVPKEHNLPMKENVQGNDQKKQLTENEGHEKNKAENSKTEKPSQSLENKDNNKTSLDNKIKSDTLNERIHNENNKSYENVHRNDSSDKLTKDESTNKKIISNPNIGITENVRAEIDKKELSVKVKSEVKSVSDKKIGTQVDSKLGSQSESNTKSTKDNSLMNDLQDAVKNGLKIENDLNKADNSFSNVLGKVNSPATLNLSESQIFPNNTAVKIVKSVEIVKELTQFITKQEKGSLTFNIKPDHLGQLKITLDLLDNALKARIEVETEQAKQLLEKNIDRLQQELIDNGVKLNSLNISLRNSKRQKDQKELKNQSNNNSKTLGQVGESEEEIKKKSLGYNTYEYIA